MSKECTITYTYTATFEVVEIYDNKVEVQGYINGVKVGKPELLFKGETLTLDGEIKMYFSDEFDGIGVDEVVKSSIRREE